MGVRFCEAIPVPKIHLEKSYLVKIDKNIIFFCFGVQFRENFQFQFCLYDFGKEFRYKQPA